MTTLFNRTSMLSCMAILSAVAVRSALAVPSISNVSQVADPSPKLSITGSGFTSKPQPQPLYYFDFEDATKSQSQKSFILSPLNATGTITSQTTPYGTGHALRYPVTNDHSATVLPRIDFDQAPDRMYVYYHRRYDFSIADSSTWGPNGLNLKPNRFWSRDGNNIVLGYQGKEGANSGRMIAEYTGNGGTLWIGRSLGQVKDEWIQEEIVYQASDLNVQNGIFDIIRNGTLPYQRKWRMRTNDRPGKYSQLYFDQISNGVNASKGLNIYYDNIYVDNSYNRVLISQSSTYSSANKRLIQVPTMWNENRIEVHLNTGGMPLNSLYVYVVDKDGNVNENGSRICISNCPEEQAPSAPPEAPSLSVE
ncbi:hypothetical protein [Marinobacter sp.]|uniref:hypothetical protein n=1 Tax=Marinobacter sp. TaxID=50741 RepID=UPI002B277786|nr:hypothetical protein [Marinobacter sp.]